MSYLERFSLSRFLSLESAGGILLVAAALLAILLANSPLQHYYALLIDTPVGIRIGDFILNKPFLLWVNDGLMAVFFLLVGLELKREFLEGELKQLKNIALPGLGAIGGMLLPAGIYIVFNHSDPTAMKGWAIPAATDIAFALGILALLGSRVPTSLKLFLTTLAIFDDVGAIIIIACFYTSNISAAALIVAAICIGALLYLNRSGVTAKRFYIIVGLIMWTALLKSGVHATLAGLILAMLLPMHPSNDSEPSPLKSLESNLHPAVAFVILPIFAFCNAGISFTGINAHQLLHPVPMGIAFGLFVGKQLGVFGMCWLGIRLRLASLPHDISIGTLYGVAILCGIGFTMSLFIGSLAFEETGINQIVDERLGILLGSLASGALGYAILRRSLSKVAA